MNPKLKVCLVRWSAYAIFTIAFAFILPLGLFTAAPVGCASSACHGEAEVTLALESSAHSAVDCASCHVGDRFVDRVRFAYYQSFGMLVPLVETEDSWVSAVSDHACQSCHEDLDRIVEADGLRIAHVSCAEGSSCVSCHSTVAHHDGITWPTTYAMETCLGCHSNREVSQNCELCHTGRLLRDVPTTGTFPITHGPNWERAHGMGDMSTCAACHDSNSFCVPCHGPGVPHEVGFINAHGVISAEPEATCLSCHRETFCESCHVYEMPHPLSFTVEHSSIVERDGETQCQMCHKQGDCTVCHEMHVHPGGAGVLEPGRGGRNVR